MNDLTYQFSDQIEKKLAEIELLRLAILSQPLSLQAEHTLRYKAKIDKVFYAFVLSGGALSKTDVGRAVRELYEDKKQKKTHYLTGELEKFYLFLSSIHFDWNAISKSIKVSNIITMYRMIGTGRLKNQKNAAFLKKILRKIDTSNDHPLVKASLLCVLIYLNELFTRENILMSHAMLFLILEKYGYDIKGMLVPQEFWKEDYNGYAFAIEQTKERGNCTIWIEYLLSSVILSCKKILLEISELSGEKTSNILLTQRQKEILKSLQTPAAQITNKKVRKMFHISQITASRELSSLVILGMLRSHGKGRSVFYTRIH